jgi:hypothetical protein
VMLLRWATPSLSVTAGLVLTCCGLPWPRRARIAVVVLILRQGRHRARADAGSGSDAVLRSVVLNLADGGSGTDAYDEHAAIGLTFADAGGGTDQSSSNMLMLLSDSGSGSDNLFIGDVPAVPVPEPGSGLGWLEQGAPARGRRSRGRVPALRQRVLPVRAVTLALADVGGGEDTLAMLFLVGEPPLYVSDILTAEPDLTEEVVDLLLVGVL